MHRLVSIDAHSFFPQVLSNAPLLQSASFLARIRLPPEQSVPVLHTLSASVAIPKKAKPLRAMRSFICHNPFRTDLRRLSRVFPNLEDLVLNGVTASTELPLTLPSTLCRLTLNGENMEYSSQLHSWRDSGCLPSEWVSLSGFVDLEAIFEFFVEPTGRTG